MEDIKRLIADWQIIREATTPFATLSLGGRQSEPELATVSLVSRQQDHWEFFVAASGYLKELGEENPTTIKRVINRIGEEAANSRAYFDAVTILPTENVLSAGTEVARIFAPTKKVRMVQAVSLTEYCREKCKGDATCLMECMLANSAREVAKWRDQRMVR